MEDHDTLFCFLDDLQESAKMELKGHGVQDLASTIASIKSLIEFKREYLKGRGKKTYEESDGEADRNSSPKRDQLL